MLWCSTPRHLCRYLANLGPSFETPAEVTRPAAYAAADAATAACFAKYAYTRRCPHLFLLCATCVRACLVHVVISAPPPADPRVPHSRRGRGGHVHGARGHLREALRAARRRHCGCGAREATTYVCLKIWDAVAAFARRVRANPRVCVSWVCVRACSCCEPRGGHARGAAHQPRGDASLHRAGRGQRHEARACVPRRPRGLVID